MAYRLDLERQLSDDVRRAAREQVTKASSELADGWLGPHEKVHQVRKRMKKVRGLLRLARPALGKAYGTENRFFRDMVRPLSDMRDAEVVGEVAAGLGNLPDLDPVTARALSFLGTAATEHRRRLALDGPPVDALLAEVADQLETAEERIGDWPLAKTLNVDALVLGYGKTYARGRAALREAETEPTSERLHDWRKRTKYHRFHLKLMRAAWPERMAAREACAKELADALGRDHDIALLLAWIEADEGAGLDRAGLAAAKAFIARHRDDGRQRIWTLGHRVYAQKPKSDRKALAIAWEMAAIEARAARAPETDAERDAA